jgi:SulP family sulfate permease
MSSEASSWWASFHRKFSWANLIPILSSGLLNGIIDVMVAVSLAALIFGGPLRPFVSIGVSIWLVTAVLTLSIGAIGLTVPGTLASLQDAPTALLAIIVAGLIRAAGPGAPVEALLATTVAVITLTTLFTGFIFIFLGWTGLGSLIRYMPYPVVGGFLAGSGWLLARGAFSVMTDLPLDLPNLLTLLQPDHLLYWVPGLLLGLLMFGLSQQFKHYLLVPGLLIAGLVAFFAVLLATGTSLEEAARRGFTLGNIAMSRPDPLIYLRTLDQIRWDLIFKQISTILAVVLVSVIALMMNIAGIELVVKQDVDLKRDLTVAGIMSITSGLLGGSIGFHMLSGTALAVRLKARSRLVGIVAGLLALVVLLLGGAFIAYLPRAVLGALLLMLGLSFLYEWAVAARTRLPLAEYLVILLILVVVIAVGVLEGVAVGLVGAIILFVINYGQVNVVRHALTGATRRSNIDRSPQEGSFLNQHGTQIIILELQGYIFFGTASRILEMVHDQLRLPNQPAATHLILDFRQVSGIDSSAVLSLLKLKQVVEQHHTMLVFTGLPDQDWHYLERGGFEQTGGVQRFDDLDHGLEWCEDQLLATHNAAIPDLLEDQLGSMMTDTRGLLPVLQYMERQQMAAGEVLIRQGEPSNDIYFVESGKLTVSLRLADGSDLRLRTMGAGTVVGEIGVYLHTMASASVIIEEAGAVYRLSREALQKMETANPAAAATFHRLIIKLTASRLVSLNQTIQALMA